MKKVSVLLMAAVMLLSMCMVTSCGKSEFGVTDNTEKAMTVNAENADKDDFFMVGTLVVADGEQVTITSGLEKGSVKIELIPCAQDQSAENVPEYEDAEATMTFEAKEAESQTGTIPAGDYMLKATATSKATGTVKVEVVAK